MEHVLVWKMFNGEIPKGYQVHHIDENKLNNEISNLQILTALAHKRIHGGCVFQNGEWIKPCIVCKKMKPVESGFYKQSKWIQSTCKECAIKAAIRNKKIRNDRRVKK